ncbi:hypothetical protein BKA61DRAFT_585739 [Leptodontidium sp. MPI-SDFR-AT-0119]|nr:hypothetical protein BKA61DRAFT_585739 [Leptodontidium sp. MPI-SDFR-AT-0119]
MPSHTNSCVKSNVPVNSSDMSSPGPSLSVLQSKSVNISKRSFEASKSSGKPSSSEPDPKRSRIFVAAGYRSQKPPPVTYQSPYFLPEQLSSVSNLQREKPDPATRLARESAPVDSNTVPSSISAIPSPNSKQVETTDLRSHPPAADAESSLPSRAFESHSVVSQSSSTASAIGEIPFLGMSKELTTFRALNRKRTSIPADSL